MPGGKSYKWWVIGMLWFVCFFNYADRQAIFSVFPLLKSEMKLSDVQLGVVGASFMWVYALAAPLAGLVGDRLERKTIILGGLIFWSLITIATALSRTYWHLVLFRAVEGLGEAFYFPASMSLVSDYHGRDTRSRAMSIHQSSVYAGTIAGGTVAGFLGQHYGWRSSFYLFGSLGVLLGIALFALLREPARGQADQTTPAPFAGGVRAALADIFRNPMVAILMAVFIGANFVAMIFLTWMPSFLYRKFGMSLAMAGLSATAYLQVASVLGVITGGVVADRLARRHRDGRMRTQAIGLLAGASFIFLTGWTLSVPVLILAMSAFGYFKGLYDANLWASLYDVVPVERRATAVGLMNSIGWLGGGVAPVAIAAASQRFGMSACLSANSAIYVMCGLLLVAGARAYMRPPIRECPAPPAPPRR
ncbi:MAG: MFS transporter [Acidobacteria bacterium]|nr:MFS transporter [Acidobacteriota bacterium]